MVDIGEAGSSRRAAHACSGLNRRTVTDEEWATVTAEVNWAPPRSSVKLPLHRVGMRKKFSCMKLLAALQVYVLRVLLPLSFYLFVLEIRSLLHLALLIYIQFMQNRNSVQHSETFISFAAGSSIKSISSSFPKVVPNS
ncbi:hypothetical protein BRADI_3g27531v3 [Brachypodium distachyon]|uniref:Uncharacterized protein n=1 Tax=Brachypodium distachyon TaxID=15368 RepID=A0A0Q3LX32_BRADI|nr:hypothetical protein BRADI_3g27531v3 [Brachypodium distachyon]